MDCLSEKSLMLGLFVVSFLCFELLEADQPCAARAVPGKSVVCVCNATYCDTITRVPPPPGGYVAYTSSEAGSRFKKIRGKFVSYKLRPGCSVTTNCDTYNSMVKTLLLNPKVLHQKISGFGGGATDSTGINWMSLKDPRARKRLIDSYFSNEGIEYSMVRVPMGGTDFSTRVYAYNEQPSDDKYLDNFTLTAEDYNFKIPFIKAAMSVATRAIRVIASIWSPPPWMKDSNSFTRGYLKREFYQTLADYFVKFMEKYKECNITIWGVTTTNEPSNGVVIPNEFNRLQWTVSDMGQWIENNLGPTIRNSSFRHVKIMVGDDQRFTVPMWLNILTTFVVGASKYIDGVAVHFYFDKFTPASQLTDALKNYPDKFIISTEASTGINERMRVDLGNWTRAEDYASDIIEDLNNKVIGWIDWNMCLNESGGPTWTDNRIDAPIIVSSRAQEFYKQPMFYALGHFSKFLPRGSRRLLVEETTWPRRLQVKTTCPCPPEMLHVAFLTPESTIVVVIMNKGEKRDVLIQLGEEGAMVPVEAKSFVTIEFLYKKSTNTTC